MAVMLKILISSIVVDHMLSTIPSMYLQSFLIFELNISVGIWFACYLVVNYTFKTFFLFYVLPVAGLAQLCVYHQVILK